MDSIYKALNISDYSNEIALTALILSFLSILLFTVNSLKIRNVIKKYKRLTRGLENKNFEAVFSHHLDRIDQVMADFEKFRQNQENISFQLKKCLQGIGIVRYNPFDKVGSDQSFSIALLDSELNGVVISGLFSRTSSVTYGKPITNGISKYALSQEEEQAINIAIENIPNSPAHKKN